MKKLLIFAIALLGASFGMHSQTTYKNAIGVRLSAGDGTGIDASYQRRVLNMNRLEFDLGLREDGHYNTVKFVGTFQWVWNIDKGFSFYAGPGIGAGRWDHDHNHGHPDDDYHNDGSYGLVAGIAGIEYQFNIPLQISFDIRPEAHFGDDRGDFDHDHHNAVPDVGLAVRYTF